MQSVLAFIIIISALVVFSYFGQPPKQEEELLKAEIQETLPQSQGSVAVTKPVVKPAEVKPAISVNTYITTGSEEGEVIEETNRVVFEFKAKISPEETEGRIIFETKVEGFDEDWKDTSSSQRIINLSSGPKEYTF